MAEQITIFDLKTMEPGSYPRALRELAKDPKAEQEAVLMDILRYAKETEFGRDHHFSEITTLEDFRRQVPVSEFASYEPYIDKVASEKEDILFPGKSFTFGGTTGTTGKSKLIPESETGDLVKRIIVKMRTAESSRMFPAQGQPGMKKFTITNGSAISSGGKTVTSASGQAVARAGAEARARLVIPTELLEIPDIESPDLDYLTMLFGAAEKNVVTLICNNVVHFNKYISLLNREPERFFADIEKGTLSANIPEEYREKLLKLFKADPARAAELREVYKKKGHLDVKDIWPSFGLVNCWLSSSVGRYAKEYAYLFPEDCLFIHWGYGATEGKFDIPVEPFSPKGIPALFGYFFEFLELGKEKPVTLTETRPGAFYELIITTYSGLYRYNIHDIVTVCSGEDGLPRMEFICKSYDSIRLNGVTLYASEITAYIEEYEKEKGVFFRYFRGEDEGGKLLLHAEPVGKISGEDFENFLREKLKASGIALSRVEILPAGTRDQALVVKMDGKVVNQTKLLVFK